jgi:hypothetical protein
MGSGEAVGGMNLDLLAPLGRIGGSKIPIDSDRDFDRYHGSN